MHLKRSAAPAACSTSAPPLQQRAPEALTVLGSHAEFELATNAAIRHAGRNGLVALLVVNLDRFHQINELFGMPHGDRLLATAARCLKDTLAHDQRLARLGGDEFCVLLSELADLESLEREVGRFHANVRIPVSAGPRAPMLSSSIGFSAYPADGGNFAELLAAATIALRETKRRGMSACMHYTEQMGSTVIDRLQLQSELAQGLRDGQFVLHFQPAVDPNTGGLRSIEALLRWRHPERGLLSADRFIGLAEENGTIVQLGEWALRQACELGRHLCADRQTRIAVNLSARQLEFADLPARVDEVLAGASLEPERLRLELTESAVMASPHESCRVLSRFAERGVELALDDFGTGLSSLRYLQQFPLTCMKIDRGFVNCVASDVRSATITRSVAALGKSLGMRVIAEGVETREQLDFVRALECDEAQGFLVGRPMPFEALIGWLAQRRSSPRCGESGVRSVATAVPRQLLTGSAVHDEHGNACWRWDDPGVDTARVRTLADELSLRAAAEDVNRSSDPYNSTPRRR